MTSTFQPVQARIVLPTKIPVRGTFFPTPVRVVIFHAAED
jgi:hypothetical protein